MVLRDRIMEAIGSLVSIPRHPATHSTPSRPPIPRDPGHPFHVIPASESERSDAVSSSLPFPAGLSQVRFLFSHGVSF